MAAIFPSAFSLCGSAPSAGFRASSSPISAGPIVVVLIPPRFAGFFVTARAVVVVLIVAPIGLCLLRPITGLFIVIITPAFAGLRPIIDFVVVRIILSGTAL